MGKPDLGLSTLLDMDGSVLEQESGFWVKLESRMIEASVKAPKKFKFAGRRLPYDHRHRTSSDKGVPYAFESAQGLLEEFFAEVDRVIKEAVS